MRQRVRVTSARGSDMTCQWAGACGRAVTPVVRQAMVRSGVCFVTPAIDRAFLVAAARRRASLLQALPLE